MFPTFSAEAEWQGQTRRFTLEVRDGTLEFWEEQHEQPEEWRFAVWHPIYKRDAAYWTCETLESLWRTAMEQNNIGRRVDLSDQLTFFLRQKSLMGNTYQRDFLRFRGKIGEVRSKVDHHRWQSLFEHPLTHWIHSLERDCCGDYEGELGEQLHELGIKFAFYSSKRNQLHLKFTRGDEADLQYINDLIWKLDPQWIEDICTMPKVEGAGIQVIVRPDKPARAIPGGAEKNCGWLPREHPRQELWDEILRYFAPSPDPVVHNPDFERGVCLFFFYLGPASEWDYFDYETGKVIEPTQHEKMELHLELRDWLRDRAGLSDERIKQLLR